MITAKSVFVLGAGASAPYGYPIGRELTQLVLEGLNSGTELWTTLQATGFSERDMASFRKALGNSGRYSVDAFLQYRAEYVDIGKAAMAHVLIRREYAAGLHGTHINQDWYRYLLHQMSAPPDEFDQNDVAFITFNYDRSLENYLFLAVKNMFGFDDQRTAAAISKIDFIHLHGDIGLLPWQGVEDARLYTPESGPAELKLAIKRMSIIHDSIAPRKEAFARAKTCIANAERILLLGFGYDALNVERLGIDQLPNRGAIGTAYGLIGEELNGVKRLTNSFIRLENCDCMTLLREYVTLT